MSAREEREARERAFEERKEASRRIEKNPDARWQLATRGYVRVDEKTGRVLRNDGVPDGK